MKKIQLIELKGCPIFKQLELEEALLRAHSENFCLINQGSSQEAIVMGISSKIEDHLNLSKVEAQKVSVIKRFSGGGTVFVDQNTLFVTFIVNRDALDIPLFPEPILRWSETFYQPVFDHPHFALRENDYVFRDKKFGGNAKYIRKDRWLLHTSFLWDYDTEKMKLLQNPKVAPNYRNYRSHQDFLIKLKDVYSDSKLLTQAIKSRLSSYFELDKSFADYPQHLLNKEHRKSTLYLIKPNIN